MLENYQQALDFLLSTINYEKIEKYRYDDTTFNLNRVRRLAEAVGSPHEGRKFVHVAGTKGKGSTCIMLASILTEHGLKTGLLTSPHLVRVEERIRINNRMMPPQHLVKRLNELVPYIDRVRRENPRLAPTYWEILTVIGLAEFAEQNADIGVIEVGLGGRLDATNIISPLVVVITRIDFDHMEKLGNTLSSIAREKAGIIKRGVPVVTCHQPEEAMQVIHAKCAETGSKLHMQAEVLHQRDAKAGGTPGVAFSLRTPRQVYKDLFLPMLGRHQTENAALAIVAAELLEQLGELKIDKDAVRRGFMKARAEARIEIIHTKPFIILDCAHNPVSARALREVIEQRFHFERLVLLMGMSRDKDIEGFLRQLAPLADTVVFTQADNPRAAEPELLAEKAEALGARRILPIRDLKEALTTAFESLGTNDVLCITGSFYLAGDAKRVIETEKLLASFSPSS